MTCSIILSKISGILKPFTTDTKKIVQKFNHLKKPKKFYEAKITASTNPYHVYIQIMDDEFERWRLLHEELQSEFQSNGPHEKPVVGHLETCMSKSSKSQMILHHHVHFIHSRMFYT